MNLDNKHILAYSLVVLVIITALLLNYEKNCQESLTCFNEAFNDCQKARVTAYQDDNQFEYRILDKEDESCKVEITITQVNPEVKQNIKDMFQDKSMICTIPISEGFTTDKLNYCQGPLKETIYELTIQKMYNLLAQNLGDIISQMKE